MALLLHPIAIRFSAGTEAAEAMVPLERMSFCVLVWIWLMSGSAITLVA